MDTPHEVAQDVDVDQTIAKAFTKRYKQFRGLPLSYRQVVDFNNIDTPQALIFSPSFAQFLDLLSVKHNEFCTLIKRQLGKRQIDDLVRFAFGISAFLRDNYSRYQQIIDSHSAIQNAVRMQQERINLQRTINDPPMTLEDFDATNKPILQTFLTILPSPHYRHLIDEYLQAMQYASTMPTALLSLFFKATERSYRIFVYDDELVIDHQFINPSTGHALPPIDILQLDTSCDTLLLAPANYEQLLIDIPDLDIPNLPSDVLSHLADFLTPQHQNVTAKSRYQDLAHFSQTCSQLYNATNHSQKGLWHHQLRKFITQHYRFALRSEAFFDRLINTAIPKKIVLQWLLTHDISSLELSQSERETLKNPLSCADIDQWTSILYIANLYPSNKLISACTATTLACTPNPKKNEHIRLLLTLKYCSQAYHPEFISIKFYTWITLNAIINHPKFSVDNTRSPYTKLLTEFVDGIKSLADIDIDINHLFSHQLTQLLTGLRHELSADVTNIYHDLLHRLGEERDEQHIAQTVEAIINHLTRTFGGSTFLIDSNAILIELYCHLYRIRDVFLMRDIQDIPLRRYANLLDILTLFSKDELLRLYEYSIIHPPEGQPFCTALNSLFADFSAQTPSDQARAALIKMVIQGESQISATRLCFLAAPVRRELHCRETTQVLLEKPALRRPDQDTLELDANVRLFLSQPMANHIIANDALMNLVNLRDAEFIRWFASPDGKHLLDLPLPFLRALITTNQTAPTIDCFKLLCSPSGKQFFDRVQHSNRILQVVSQLPPEHLSEVIRQQDRIIAYLRENHDLIQLVLRYPASLNELETPSALRFLEHHRSNNTLTLFSTGALYKILQMEAFQTFLVNNDLVIKLYAQREACITKMEANKLSLLTASKQLRELCLTKQNTLLEQSAQGFYLALNTQQLRYLASRSYQPLVDWLSTEITLPDEYYLSFLIRFPHFIGYRPATINARFPVQALSQHPTRFAFRHWRKPDIDAYLQSTLSRPHFAIIASAQSMSELQRFLKSNAYFFSLYLSDKSDALNSLYNATLKFGLSDIMEYADKALPFIFTTETNGTFSSGFFDFLFNSQFVHYLANGINDAQSMEMLLDQCRALKPIMMRLFEETHRTLANTRNNDQNRVTRFSLSLSRLATYTQKPVANNFILRALQHHGVGRLMQLLPRLKNMHISSYGVNPFLTLTLDLCSICHPFLSLANLYHKLKPLPHVEQLIPLVQSTPMINLLIRANLGPQPITTLGNLCHNLELMDLLAQNRWNMDTGQPIDLTEPMLGLMQCLLELERLDAFCQQPAFEKLSWLVRVPPEALTMLDQFGLLHAIACCTYSAPLNILMRGSDGDALMQFANQKLTIFGEQVSLLELLLQPLAASCVLAQCQQQSLNRLSPDDLTPLLDTLSVLYCTQKHPGDIGDLVIKHYSMPEISNAKRQKLRDPATITEAPTAMNVAGRLLSPECIVVEAENDVLTQHIAPHSLSSPIERKHPTIGANTSNQQNEGTDQDAEASFASRRKKARIAEEDDQGDDAYSDSDDYTPGSPRSRPNL